MRHILKGVAALFFAVVAVSASAQKYQGIVDKTIAVVGNEVIMISDIESEMQMMLYNYGMQSDRKARCELLESMMSSKLFLMFSSIGESVWMRRKRAFTRGRPSLNDSLCDS